MINFEHFRETQIKIHGNSFSLIQLSQHNLKRMLNYSFKILLLDFELVKGFIEKQNCTFCESSKLKKLRIKARKFFPLLKKLPAFLAG